MNKIGLLTYHHTTNFGSLLQTYALYDTVVRWGFDCEVIDYRNEAVEKREFLKPFYQCKDIRELKNHILYSRFRKKKANTFAKFIEERMQVSSQRYDRTNIEFANNYYNCFLVGSDLVWDFSINGNDTTYMLDFTRGQCRKIAFASSVGAMWGEDDQIVVKRLLSEFDCIGVREHTIQERLKATVNEKIDFVCDPTMLLTGNQWKSMAAPRCIQEEYVLCYMSDEKLEIYRDAVAYGKKHNLPVYLISYNWVPEDMKPVRPNSIEEFLSLVANANTIFSASYHGMLFSLYFNKNFYYYNRGWKERMKSIAEYLNLTEREHWSPEKDEIMIDYNFVNQKIDDFREKSLHILQRYLGKK